MKKIIQWFKRIFKRLFGRKQQPTQYLTYEAPVEETVTLKQTAGHRHYTYFDRRLNRVIRKPSADL